MMVMIMMNEYGIIVDWCKSDCVKIIKPKKRFEISLYFNSFSYLKNTVYVLN